VTDYFALSLPIFAVIAIGWGGMRSGLLPAATVDVLGAFSFRVALPALVLRLIAGQPLSQTFEPAFYFGYLLSGGIVLAGAFTVSSRIAGQGSAKAGAHATTAAVSNLGFLGPPLMLAYFGDRGAGPLAMAILAEVMVLMSIGSAIMASARSAHIGSATVLLRSTVLNPVVSAIGLGALFAALEWTLPKMMDRTLGYLAGAAGPTALFAIGGTLAALRLNRQTVVAAGTIALAKIVIYPLLAWAVLKWGLKLDPLTVQAGVVLASLPPASSAFVLAQRYQADEGRVSAALLLCTLASAATVPLAAWLAKA